MSSAADLLRYARGQLGYYAPADPEPGSRAGRWMAERTGEAWLAGPSTQIAWCACFVSMCLGEAGVRCAGFPSYNCDYAIQHATGSGNMRFSKFLAEPGDIVFFDWDRNGSRDHVGIVEENRGSYLQTIEGNTSDNRVARRTRGWGYVTHVLRPAYDAVVATDAPLVVDGWLGPLSVAKLQRQLGCMVCDGIVSGQDMCNRRYLERMTSVTWEANGRSPVVVRLQRLVGAAQDGFLGHVTVERLQEWLNARGAGLDADGYLGPLTAMAVQRAENEGAFGH